MSQCGLSMWRQCNLSRPCEIQILCGWLLLFYAQYLLYFKLIVWPKTIFLLLACYFDWLEESKSSDHMQTGWTRWSRSILTVTGYWLFWALPCLFWTRIMSCFEMFLFSPTGVVSTSSLCFKTQQHQSNTCMPYLFQHMIVQLLLECIQFNL